MNKKKTFVLAVLVILVALISTSTLAWFSATDKVENDFLIAGSESGEADDIFSVDVYEFIDGVRDEDGYEYENILPGANLSKDVFVENTGAYDQYVRVEVTISNKDAWLAAAAKYGFEVTDCLVGYDPTLWAHVWNNLTEQPNAEDIVYVLYYIDELAKGEKINVFNSVKIPTQLTQEDAALFEGGFSINVVATAVQTENVGAEGVAQEDKAWTAFNYVANN